MPGSPYRNGKEEQQVVFEDQNKCLCNRNVILWNLTVEGKLCPNLMSSLRSPLYV